MAHFRHGDGNRSQTFLHRDTGDDQRLCLCDMGAQLLFERMLRWTDNRGRTKADPETVARRCFARNKGWHRQVPRWLEQLHDKGLLFLFEDRAEKFAFFPGFFRYNPIRGNAKPTSDLPFPDPAPLLAWAGHHARDMEWIEAEIAYSQQCIDAFKRNQLRLNASEPVHTEKYIVRQHDRPNESYIHPDAHPDPRSIGRSEESADDEKSASPPCPPLNADAYALAGLPERADLAGKVAEFAVFWNALTGNNIGGVGNERVQRRLAAGWTVPLLKQASADIVTFLAENKGAPPNWFTPVDNRLDKWAKDHPRGLSPEGDGIPHEEETLALSHAYIQERRQEAETEARGDAILAGMTEAEKRPILDQAELTIGRRLPGRRHTSKAFEAAMNSEARRLAVERLALPETEEPHPSDANGKAKFQVLNGRA